MNYLAHFYLAYDDDGLIVGNFLADHAKGRSYLELPDDYQRGVLLHRSIDDFTDNHPIVEETKSRLRDKYRKYAPVISDVFYDYFLGSNWELFSDRSLKDFSNSIYRKLKEHEKSFPMPARITLGYMSENDWLYHYSTYYGIEMALKGLTRRATFKSNMHEAIHDLKKYEEDIQKEFFAFFADLKDHVEQEKQKIR